MKIKKTYTLQIEGIDDNQFFKVYRFLSDLVDKKMYFVFYPYVEENLIVVEYLNEEYFEKISNFLKTL